MSSDVTSELELTQRKLCSAMRASPHPPLHTPSDHALVPQPIPPLPFHPKLTGLGTIPSCALRCCALSFRSLNPQLMAGLAWLLNSFALLLAAIVRCTSAARLYRAVRTPHVISLELSIGMLGVSCQSML